MSSAKKDNKKNKALRVEVKIEGFEILIKPIGVVRGFEGRKRIYKKRIQANPWLLKRLKL